MTSGTHTTTLRSHSSLAARSRSSFNLTVAIETGRLRKKKMMQRWRKCLPRMLGAAAERCHVGRKEGVQAGKGVAPGTLSPSSLPTNVRTSLSICLILGHYGLCI